MKNGVVRELNDGSGPGVYWFWSPTLLKWVVADLDTGKAYRVSALAVFTLRSWSEGRDRVDTMRTGLMGVVGDRVVMEHETMIQFLREYADDVVRESFALYESTGKMYADPPAFAVWNRVSELLAVAARRHDASNPNT